MRRHLTAASAAVLLLAALTACGGGDSEPNTVADPPAAVSTPTPEASSTPSESASSTASQSASASAGSTGTASTGEELKITIQNFAFSPKILEVKPGQKITVTNLDTAVHTLTANDKSIDSGDLGQGKSYTFTAPQSGSVDYICTPHPYMKGTLKVS